MESGQEARSAALLKAAASGNLQLVQEHALGDSGVDVVNDKGRTLLMLAARSGHIDIVRYLIDSGADVNARDEAGSTALIQASEGTHDEVGLFLVERGADVNAADTEGTTPLMIAAENECADLVHCLVEHGADVNAADNNGLTPVMAASTWGLVDIVTYLVEHGADVNATTKKGTTALIHAAIYGEVELIHYLVECGANVRATRDDGWTPLIGASRFGRLEAVECLIEHGADVNAATEDGSAALLVSSTWGHSTVARQLLDSGADVNTANSDGATPVMVAAANGHDEVVRELVDSKADVNMKDAQSRNAMHLAAKHGHSDIQRMLLPLLQDQASPGQIARSPTISRESGWLIPPFEVELVTFVHTGSFGGDYRAKWLGADVVVKLFVPDASSTTFADEVSVWRELRHPNVIKLYGACDALHQFFVCEYASNGSVVEYLEACDPDQRSPWKYLYEAALGLEYLRERNIVHGDLRCNNILIGSDGTAKLAEFGLSGSNTTRKLTTADSFGGSMRWQAPERLKGAPASFASDIYSLGLCFVEAATRKVPWDSCFGILLGFIKDTWHPETETGMTSTNEPGGLTGDARDLMLRMCAHDPQLRPSIAEVVRELSRLPEDSSSASDDGPARPVTIRDIKAQWGEQRQGRIALFVRSISEMASSLSGEEAKEDECSLLAFLNAEATTRSFNYSADQLQVLQKAYKDIEQRVGDAVVTTPAPVWLVPWYELEINKWSCLGEGGFGSVWRAKWFDTEVVVKEVKLAGAPTSKVAASLSHSVIVSDSYASTGTSTSLGASATDGTVRKERRASVLRMFKREADIWFGLRHPHVVRLFGACHVGAPFFVCEFAAKGTLIHYIRANTEQVREKPEFVWAKLYEAALGLLYLHERSVVHGDLKCDNIMVGSDEKAKVTDFGLSSFALQADGAQITGAWQWVAPECLGGSGPTFESDVYSFGMCVIQAMRVVEEALASDDDHVMDPYPWGNLENVVVKVNVLTLRQLPARPSRCTDAQWSLIERMCKHDPHVRVKMTTVVDELAKFASGELLAASDESSTTDPSMLMAQVPYLVSEMNQFIAEQEEYHYADNYAVLSKIYALLWDRISQLSVQLGDDDDCGQLAALQSLVEEAQASTLAIPESHGGFASFTEMALRGYALHRQLDKFLDAAFTHKEDRRDANTADWKSQCYAFLGVEIIDALEESVGALKLSDMEPPSQETH